MKECISPLPGKDSFSIFIMLLSDSVLGFYILLGVLLDNKQSGSDSLGNKIYKSDLVLASPDLLIRSFLKQTDISKPGPEMYIHL